MKTTQYLLKPAVLASVPEITITKQDYLNAKRCHKQNYEAFEIELAFDFLVTNYIEIEKYIAEHLVLDMVSHTHTIDAMRAQQWGFIRTLNNWLASISFWRDLTRSRLISICGRGSELKNFEDVHLQLKQDEFVYAFLFHLRNYSQHGGFPITGSSTGGSWNKERTKLSFSANYTLNYDQIRPYFDKNGPGAKARKVFGRRIEAYCQGEPFDLKPIIRQSLGLLGLFMDRIRSSMEQHVSQNEALVLDMIEKFRSIYPSAPVVGLSAMPVDDRKIVRNRTSIVPVRDEFIVRARELRKKNNSKSLKSMEKRIISNI